MIKNLSKVVCTHLAQKLLDDSVDCSMCLRSHKMLRSLLQAISPWPANNCKGTGLGRRRPGLPFVTTQLMPSDKEPSLLFVFFFSFGASLVEGTVGVDLRKLKLCGFSHRRAETYSSGIRYDGCRWMESCFSDGFSFEIKMSIVFFQRPLALGADICMCSATKYMNGKISLACILNILYHR